MEREQRNLAISTTSQTRQPVPPVAGPSNWQDVTNSRRSNSLKDIDLNFLSSHTLSEQNYENDEGSEQSFHSQNKPYYENDEFLEYFKLCESTLEEPLKTPDRLVNDKAQVTTTKGERETISKEQDFIIIDEDQGRYKIKYYKWNSNIRDPRKRLEIIEAWITKDNVMQGSTAQTPLENIKTGIEKNSVQILPNESSGIRQKDVYQNGISNCHLQAALIAIAKQKPQQILNMVTVNEDDVTVRFYLYDNEAPNIKDPKQKTTKTLTRKDVSVNKSLLLDDKGQLVYSGKLNDDSYLWPAFIEKAWAVVKGGYAESAMGITGDVIKAITGEGSSMPFELMESWEIYKKLEIALGNHKAAVLSTQVFAKKGIKQIINKMKKPSADSDQPHGDIRVLHAYAVLGMNPTNLTEEHFQNSSIPDVTLTLCDPRNSKGETFKRTLKEVITSSKYNAVHTG